MATGIIEYMNKQEAKEDAGKDKLLKAAENVPPLATNDDLPMLLKQMDPPSDKIDHKSY